MYSSYQLIYLFFVLFSVGYFALPQISGNVSANDNAAKYASLSNARLISSTSRLIMACSSKCFTVLFLLLYQTACFVAIDYYVKLQYFKKGRPAHAQQNSVLCNCVTRVYPNKAYMLQAYCLPIIHLAGIAGTPSASIDKGPSAVRPADNLASHSEAVRYPAEILRSAQS